MDIRDVPGTADSAVDPHAADATDAMIRLRDSAYASDMFLAATCWLDLIGHLAEQPADLAGLCDRLGTVERPTDVMLTLFKAWGLIEQRGERFHPTDKGRDHLVAGAPNALNAYYASLKDRPAVHDMLYVLRTGHSKSWEEKQKGGKEAWSELMQRPDFAEFYTAGMDSRGAILARSLAGILPAQGRRRLLDVAGGSGIYAVHAVERHPHLTAAVTERPPVDQVTRHHLEKRGLSDRIDVVGGDMFADPFPEDFDIHLYSHILHDWPLDKARFLVEKSFQSLAPGGMIGIFSAHLDTDKAGPAAVAEYSVLMMYLYEGRCYSFGEMAELLEGAGFVDVSITPAAGARSLITATKP